jgi:dynein heavy chain
MKDCTNETEEDTIFADFMEESGGKYVEVGYKDRDQLKKFADDKLKDYNEKTKASSMNIVLF